MICAEGRIRGSLSVEVLHAPGQLWPLPWSPSSWASPLLAAVRNLMQHVSARKRASERMQVGEFACF